MIIVLTAAGKGRTHRKPVKWPDMPQLRRWSYWYACRRKSVPAATYIFTDFDRLAPWELELASRLHKTLLRNGMRVLNDPGHFQNRYQLLTTLHSKAINDFKVWSVGLGQFPEKFPVFLRTQAAHRGIIGNLLTSADEAQQALDDALDQGYVAQDLIFVEYAAEAQQDGIFRKLAAFRVGDEIVQTIAVHSRDWIAKLGEPVGCHDLYIKDLNDINTTTYRDAVMQAFQAVDLQYGRADFGLVGGRPQFYEINLNPHIGETTPHEFRERNDADMVFRGKYVKAMQAIDTPASRAKIKLDDEVFTAQRRNDWPTLGYHRSLK